MKHSLTSASAAHLMLSLFLNSSVSNVGDKSRVRDDGVAGMNGREKYFPDKGSLVQADQCFFAKMETEQN